MNEVPALVAERRRYEGWLTALDARRGDTPAHVFERVQADYRARLQRVDEELASHRQAIEEERASVQSRLSLCEAEERMSRDERAELELRAHVGELVGEEADEAFRTVDESLEKLGVEKNGLQERIDELDALLGMRATPVASAESPTAATAAEPTRPVTPAAPAAAVADEQLAIAEPVPERSHESLRPSFDEMAFLNTVVGSETSETSANASSSVATAPNVALPPGPSGPANRGSGAHRHSESRRDSGVVRMERASESLLAGLAESPRDPNGEAPLAANVTANQPIVLRSGSLEGSKTLKCGECGSMNYPTEWYCERCGAELAAL